MSLKEYLSSKPLYYERIDYDRMPRVFKSVKDSFKFPKTIHIVGTNGKGSIGRYLAKMMELEGLKVGHYTSPHILEFNERFYKNGALIEMLELEKLHLKLLDILGEREKELSYFEYATFLAFLAYEDCDYMLLEAGVGGEFDATNAVSKTLYIVASISIDHQDLLGGGIEDIASTKLASVNNAAVIAPQEYDEVMSVIERREKICGFDFLYANKNDIIDDIENYALKFSLPKFLKYNLLTAYKAALLLGLSPDLKRLDALDLRGRCEKIAANITLDVGHNVDAAKALSAHFSGKKVVLVYNSYRDKDYISVLKVLRPIIKRVELIDMQNSYRENARREIEKYLDFLGVERREYKNTNNNEEYLVFGSFGVAESFLKSLNER
jgi:dihydrofolate synthase/folylpolyglutamate synthase